MIIKNFTSLPAQFISVSPNSDGNPLFTRAKLRVFYVGETVDHRLFTDDFAKLLMVSLPYAPVVSYYNSDKDDFQGHAEQQCIYGIVDPMTQPTFELDKDGTKWAICDVILYTERPDQTGEIAQKIIGHPESLELNPKTVQYKINRDRTGKFRNLEFTYGQFIGVSVLGKDEKPAFTGAQFFNSKDFLKEIEDCTNRGTKMNIAIPSFVQQSWNEIQKAVAEALEKKFVDGFYLVDMYDTFCVIYLWDAEANTAMLMKVPYTCEIKDGNYNVTFGDPVRVHVTYEDMKAQTAPIAQAAETPVTAPAVTPAETTVTTAAATDVTPAVTTPVEPATEMACGDGEKPEDKEDPKKKKHDEEDPDEEEDPECKKKKCGASAEKPEETDLKKKDQKAACTVTSAEEVNSNVQTDTTSKASLSDSEHEELKAYRKQDKLSLIDTYSESLDSKVIEAFKEKVDTYSKEDLTNALNAEFVKTARSHSKDFSAGLSWIPDEINSNNDGPKSADDELAAKIAARKRGNK